MFEDAEDLSSILSVRSRLRHVGFSQREQLSEHDRHIFSYHACFHMIHALEQRIDNFSQLIVSGYWPIKSELTPLPFLEYVLSQGGRLALPAVIDKTTMVFRSYSLNDPLERMAFNTFGPEEKQAILVPNIVIVPLLAFDRQGHRLGYGKGYYDRALFALKAQGHSVQLWGLGFSCQEVPSIPAIEHDLVLHGIFTEKDFFEC
ncbi:5-formyltetrahydrofolate cyclo-ligase [Bartonella ancashensis]|uniref:5-formyltetrahydrofolate cyclo-ligase n=1 Tax=Bartonella ancashensis TaxID=1318743 RepID=A0A0M3T2P3_9HYPH|nr:5-formyltetrahydrofolate cyclo-ligase [Bartonella ancashensis]ALE03085.1 5-formyltetrahydrofolate cyclo-ligase [Bartonella ancashensis]